MKITPVLLFVGLISASYGFSAPSQAQFNPFSRLVSEHGDMREPDASALWFERADGEGRFVFDQSYMPGLIWDERAQEIWIVTPRRASGGGMVWVTDTGEVRLQFTHIGGATYFPEDTPDGIMVEEVGRAHTLAADPMDNDDLGEVAQALANGLSAHVGEALTLRVEPRGSLDNGYVAECLHVIDHAAHQLSAADLADLEAIEVLYDLEPGVVFEEGVLRVTMVPEMGYGGRPSSEKIVRALQRRPI
ncbi:DUF4908 domain-containing protein [Woodsholea maritima]|uniref:DUF4908 domain-containing protein n=1 Tax=Woodsholea maritima TaxID=240237 RepID=UPI00036E20D0|nr:DUF4908 domain-containing protein [Woodsholea maritima]